MKSHKNLLCSLFLLSLLCFLASGTILLATVSSLSGPGLALVLLLLSLAEAGGLAGLVYRVTFSFRRSAQLLPRELCAKLEDQPVTDQFHLLCQSYAQKHEDLRSMSADRLLTHLLEDNTHTHVIENLRQQIQDILHSEIFGFRWTSYCLVYVRLEDYESYMLKTCDGHFFFEDFRRMYEVVSHTFSTMLNQRNIAYGVERKNACVFLVNLANTAKDTPRSELEKSLDGLYHGCEDMVRTIGESFNVTLEAVLSTPFQDVTETYSIYEWMLTMKEYSDFVAGPRPVLGPQDCQQFLAAPHAMSSPTEKTYYSALLAEDFVKAEQALYEMELYALANNGCNVPALKSVMRLCLSAAEDIATSNTFSSKSILSLDWRTAIQKAETQQQLEEAIHSFFDYLISRSGKRRSECSSTTRKITAFLDEHYTCPDLSITMLSDALSLSPSYISRIFKREVGVNVPDYIHEKRVRRAKELLSTTDLPLNDVAQQVGYSTAWTMNRIFKRVVHMTPGAWRQVAQSNQEETQP